MPVASKTERSREDATAAMGVVTTDVLTRVMASLGKLEQAPTDLPRACEAVPLRRRALRHPCAPGQ